MEKIKRTESLKTIQLDNGNNYSKVAERVKFLAEHFTYSIETEEQFYEDIKTWKVKATLTIFEEGNVLKYTGTAMEKIGANEINLTSALENAETSAVGRACAFAGIGITDDIASEDEIRKSERQKEVILDDKIEHSKQASRKAEEEVLKRIQTKTKTTKK